MDIGEAKLPDEIRLILSPPAFDAVQSEYPVLMKRLIGIDQMDIRITDTIPPFGLLIFDELVALAGFDDVGRIDVLVEAESDSAIEWGRRKVDAYWSEGERCDE